MSLFRFVPDKGIRRRGKHYEQFHDTFRELDEEDFKDREEFCQAIASQLYEFLNDLDEGEDE